MSSWFMFPETSLNGIVLFLLSPLPILLSSQVHFHLLVVIPLSSFGSPSVHHRPAHAQAKLRHPSFFRHSLSVYSNTSASPFSSFGSPSAREFVSETSASPFSFKAHYRPAGILQHPPFPPSAHHRLTIGSRMHRRNFGIPPFF